MRDLIIAVLWLSFTACVTAHESLVPDPEQMPEGRVQCKALCASYGREYKEYRYDGKCVCKSNDVSSM